MTSKFLTRGLLIAGVALVSCNEIDPDRNTAGDNVIITATIESEGVTRSCIDSTPYDGKTGILWTPDDCIGVFGSATTNAKFTNTSTTNEATTGFTGTLADGDKPQYAYYPYSSTVGMSVSELSGSVSAKQSYSESTGLLTDDWKYGKSIATSTDGKKYKFKMTHLFALAKVVINATGTPIEGETLESIAIKATAGTGSDVRRINGAFTFSAVDGSYTLSGNAVDGTDNTTTMVWSDNPALESGKSYTGYITLIPDVKKGDKITVTITTSGHTAVFEVPCIQDLKSGHIYNLPMTLTALAEKMKAEYGTIPTYTDNQENVVTTGEFTACAFNVDGLPDISYIFGSINPDGPGKDGTTEMAGIANNLGWDFIAASEDFEYHSQLASGLSNYNSGTYRGTVTSSNTSASSRADTDGLCFFWKKDLTVTSEGNSPGSNGWEKMVQYTNEYGGLTGGANTCIKKGFRHYEVEVSEGVVVDVYITHMNTYSSNNADKYLSAQIGQLCQIRDYALTKAAENKRPAIIMGDTNMRYTRHDIKTNLLDYVANAGYSVSDPWVEFYRPGYPTYGTKSLMIRAHANSDGISSDIICADDQRGEVVDKIWYINVPGAEVQLKATAHKNDIDNFKTGENKVTFSKASVEDENGNVTEGQTISYYQVDGYSDHFPVVTTFQWTKTVKAE